MMVEFVGGPFDGKRLELPQDKHEYRASLLEPSGQLSKYIYRIRTENGVPVRLPDGTIPMCYQPVD
jgi:hypothetical protein